MQTGRKKISKSKIFLICCIALIIGVALGSFMPHGWLGLDLLWFSGMMVGLVITVLFWKSEKFRLMGLVSLFLFFGIWRYAISLPASTSDKIWYYNGETVALEGVIVDEPDIRESNTKYEVRSTRSEVRGANVEVKGKVLVTANKYPEFDYGDEVELTCDLQAPEEFSGFAYDRYLARFDIYSVCYYPQIKKLKSEQGNWLYAKIFNLKNKLREKINFGLTEPYAGLAKAIILGDKRGIDPELRIQFAQAGISHIVAISGMHISLLTVMVMTGLIWVGLSRRQSVYATTILLILYLLLIGLPASAMRAGLMGFLVMLALSLGRLNRLLNALLLAAAVLLIINPRLLRDDIGFQLSFLAVLGIAYFYPLINSLLNRIKVSWLKKIRHKAMVSGIIDIIIITLAAQVMTLPILASNFSQVSVVAPLTNLLVLWTLPFIMVGGLLALGLSLVIPGLAVLFFLPVHLLFLYINEVSGFLVTLPFSYWEIDYVWAGWWILYYMGLVWVIWKFRKRKNLMN